MEKPIAHHYKNGNPDCPGTLGKVDTGEGLVSIVCNKCLVAVAPAVEAEEADAVLADMAKS